MLLGLLSRALETRRKAATDFRRERSTTKFGGIRGMAVNAEADIGYLLQLMRNSSYAKLDPGILTLSLYFSEVRRTFTRTPLMLQL